VRSRTSRSDSLVPSWSLYVIFAVWYLAWRPTTFNPQAMTFSIVLYVAELLGFVAALMHIFMVWRLTIREAPAAPMGLT
jgi:cellulose synthase (UDP-forming)